MAESRLIKKIYDEKLDWDLSDTTLRIKKRKAVRVVLLDDKGRIGLIHARNGNYHKLAGGGIEEGETQEEAVFREVIEETGFESEVIYQIGHTIEYYYTPQKYREKFDGMVGYSYCWVARATKYVGANLMEDEASDGFELIWANSTDEAIGLFRDAPFTGTKHSEYDFVKMIEERDRIILEAYKSKEDDGKRQ